MRTPWWRTAGWRPARRSAGSRASPLHSNVTLRDITWHYVTLCDTCQVATSQQTKTWYIFVDVCIWQTDRGRKHDRVTARGWHWPGRWRLEMYCLDWYISTYQGSYERTRHVGRRRNFVDFRWQSKWHCQVVQCFSVAQIKSPSPASPVYGWGLRVQTIYTHRQLRLDFLFS